jgi:hypothetical protein
MNPNADKKAGPRVGDRGYTRILTTLAALWVLGPVFDLFNLNEVGEVILLSVVLIAGVAVMRGKGILFFVVIGMGICLGAMLWVHFSSPLGSVAYIAMNLVGAFFFGSVAFELLRDILSTRRTVTIQLIHGAIAVYVLIGICFSFVYVVLFIADPAAFKGVEDSAAAFSQFVYFSFVTLTTLGYGDVTPMTRLGGSFATMEATVGQVYLTVLVARLVGMQISQQTTE